jgi:hypothetical protein
MYLRQIYLAILTSYILFCPFTGMDKAPVLFLELNKFYFPKSQAQKFSFKSMYLML